VQIEESEVGPLSGDEADGFLPRRSLAHDRDVIEPAKERREKGSRRPFVVGNDDANAGVQ
jgi:hypothetical protein